MGVGFATSGTAVTLPQTTSEVLPGSEATTQQTGAAAGAVDSQTGAVNEEEVRKQFADIFAQEDFKKGVSLGTFERIRVVYTDKLDEFLAQNPNASQEDIQKKVQEFYSNAQMILSNDKALSDQGMARLEEARKRMLEIIKP